MRIHLLIAWCSDPSMTVPSTQRDTCFCNLAVQFQPKVELCENCWPSEGKVDRFRNVEMRQSQICQRSSAIKCSVSWWFLTLPLCLCEYVHRHNIPIKCSSVSSDGYWAIHMTILAGIFASLNCLWSECCISSFSSSNLLLGSQTLDISPFALRCMSSSEVRVWCSFCILKWVLVDHHRWVQPWQGA